MRKNTLPEKIYLKMENRTRVLSYECKTRQGNGYTNPFPLVKLLFNLFFPVIIVSAVIEILSYQVFTEVSCPSRRFMQQHAHLHEVILSIVAVWLY
jgi:hypothetical protein